MASPCRGRACFSAVEDNSPLCIDCWAYRDFLRRDLVRLWLQIPSVLVPSHQKSMTTVISSPVQGRAPLRECVLHMQERVLMTVTNWAEVIVRKTAARGTGCTSSGRPAWRFTHALDILDRLDRVMADDADIASYYNGIYDARRALSLLIDGSTRETEHLDVFCPACASATICHREHRSYLVCLTCGSRWGHATWHSLT